MEQPVTSDLPTFYGERTKNGKIPARASHDDAEEMTILPAATYGDRRAGRHRRQIDLIPFGGPYEGPRNRARFEDDPRGDRDYCRRVADPPGRDPPSRQPWRARRDSAFDWDLEARRRASDRCRSETLPNYQYNQDTNPDSGNEDYYCDRRGLTQEGCRRRLDGRSSRGRRRGVDGNFEEYLDEKHGGQGGSQRPPTSTEEPMRIPWTMWMNFSPKNDFAATIGEFVGTTMFLFFAFADMQVANISASAAAHDSTSGGATGFNQIVFLYISFAFGFSPMVNIWVFSRISGGLFNPAVTFAMVLVKSIPIIRALCLVGAQITGAIFASYLVKVLFSTPLNIRTTLLGYTSIARGVFIEAVLTAEVVFTIFMLAKEKHKATFIAPIGMGLALFLAELVGVFYTSIEIYWVGPGTGAIVAVIFYKFITTLEYELANPRQDGDEKHDPTKFPNFEVNKEPRNSSLFWQ